ncbi:alcohol dehydrogenase groES-like domain-containing protein [Ditylenchus destructor]|nr:alcohol dehydrogenase groES-like domain-containing protein [Ditylenchus destructor]
MDTNLSAVLYGKNDFRVEPRPIPACGPNNLLIKVHSVGICGTDTHLLQHAEFARAVITEPTVIGHEASGIVDKVGKNVTNFSAGDRVVMECTTICGKCEDCTNGVDNICENVGSFGGFGAFAKWVSVPAGFCHKLPDHMTFEEGALMEPLSCAYHGCVRAGVKKDQKILICGSGAIGTLTLLAAKTLSPSKVVATDISDERLSTIKDRGADHVVNVSRKTPKEAALAIRKELGGEPDVVLECTGLGMSIETAIYAVKNGGTVCIIGMGSARADIPIIEAISKEIQIVTSLKNKHDEFPVMLDAVASGKIDLKQLTFAHFKLGEIKEAFKKALAAEVTKVMVHPQE